MATITLTIYKANGIRAEKTITSVVPNTTVTEQLAQITANTAVLREWASGLRHAPASYALSAISTDALELVNGLTATGGTGANQHIYVSQYMSYSPVMTTTPATGE